MAKKVSSTSTAKRTEEKKKRISSSVTEEEIIETGVVEGQEQQPTQEINYKPLRVSLWSRMGGFFRTGARIGIGAVVGAGVAHAAATAIAASSLPLATAQVASFIAATITAGGVGAAVLGIGAVTAGVAAIVRAANPNYRALLNQKALVRKLAKNLKRGKNHTLTPEQQKTLAQALQNPKLSKFLNRQARKFDRSNPEKLIGHLKYAAEHGRTNVAPQPARGLFGLFQRIFRRRTTQEIVEEETRTDEEETRTDVETNDQIYTRIMSKSIFGANLSAREWLALQQIYNAEMKALRADIRKLSAKDPLTVDEKKELAEKVAMEKKITNLEERAFRAAKKAAQAEAADNNNSLSPEERAIFQDFAQKGRRSTEAKKVITDDDRKRAVQGVATYTRLTEETEKTQKPKAKSGGR